MFWDVSISNPHMTFLFDASLITFTSTQSATPLPCAPNAILFNYVHDVSRSDTAVQNVLGQAQPGARVAMAGMKFFPWWLAPLNLLAWFKNRPYNVLAADMRTPWDRVAPHCTGWQVTPTQGGMGYIAWGTLRK